MDHGSCRMASGALIKVPSKRLVWSPKHASLRVSPGVPWACQWLRKADVRGQRGPRGPRGPRGVVTLLRNKSSGSLSREHGIVKCDFRVKSPTLTTGLLPSPGSHWIDRQRQSLKKRQSLWSASLQGILIHSSLYPNSPNAWQVGP